MRQWHKRIKLFSKKYIFLPINKKDHWQAVIIVNLHNLHECIKKDTHPRSLPVSHRPYIFFLDPLLAVEEKLDFILRLYLEGEVKEILGPSYELRMLQKDDQGKSHERFILTEDFLPHYQLIVEKA